MEPTYNLFPLDITGIAAEEPSAEAQKICPGLHCFCPHYAQGVCDVKYQECTLLNSLKISETILRMEREHLLKSPTQKHIELIGHINDVLRDTADMTLDPAIISWNKRKGQMVAMLLFGAIMAAAALIYFR